jgi:hypothetical protein
VGGARKREGAVDFLTATSDRPIRSSRIAKTRKSESAEDRKTRNQVFCVFDLSRFRDKKTETAPAPVCEGRLQ